MRFRRIIGTATAAAALVATGVVTAGPAAASHNSQSISPTCGTTLNIAGHAGDIVNVFTTNLQNCFGDGLILQGSNYIVQVNGTIDGAAPANEDPGDNAGIRILNGTNIRVRYGAVQQFDAGVAIIGGSRNVVQAMRIRDNVNEGVGLNTCEMGDGVYVLNSDANQILNSTIIRNGPFSGVSFIEDSDNNLARRNIVSDNRAGVPVPGVAQCVTNLNAGFRIEGPGAQFNRIDDNTIERNLFAGVALHEYLSELNRPELQGGCNPEANPRTPPVSDNRITNNRVRQNGTTADAIAGGITTFDIGLGDACAATRSTITGNEVVANIGNGIYLAATSHDNQVHNNAVTANTRDGIAIGGPQFSNTFTNVGPTLVDPVNPDLPPYTQCPNPQTNPATPCDYRVIPGSGSGDVTAQVVSIDPAINNVNGTNTNPVDTSTSGCEQSDYDNNPEWDPGDIALIQRGTCTFVSKVNLAIANGASAVILYNEGQAGRQTYNFGGSPIANIPVLAVTYQKGLELQNVETLHVVTNTTNVPTQAASGAEDNELHNNRGQNNGGFDGADYNPNCDNNHWMNNHFGTVNQLCVIANGGTGTVPPPA